MDNGVPQQLHVDDDLDNEPVSVVVAVEKGRMAALEFDKINRLAPLIDLFLGDGSSEAAFVSFDSKPQLVVPFTKDDDRLGHELKRIEPGDGGAAILDTVGYSVKLLEDRPKDYRRVLLLISETRDHGSRDVDARRAGGTDRHQQHAGSERHLFSLQGAVAARSEAWRRERGSRISSPL